MTTPKRRTIVLATALAVLPAVGVSAATRPAKRPRYYFKIVEVNVGKLDDPGLEASARELLGKELAARPEFTADVQAGSDEALEEELKRRKLRGFLVSLRIDELAKDLKPPRPGGRLKQLAVGTKLSVFGTTFPGEKLAFGGDGEAVVEAEVVESRVDAETPPLIKDALAQALKQAVDQTVAKLSLPRAAPINETRRKRR
jgi:hypothetical protein